VLNVEQSRRSFDPAVVVEPVPDAIVVDERGDVTGFGRLGVERLH
jgi:hypothetical protein